MRRVGLLWGVLVRRFWAVRGENGHWRSGQAGSGASSPGCAGRSRAPLVLCERLVLFAGAPSGSWLHGDEVVVIAPAGLNSVRSELSAAWRSVTRRAFRAAVVGLAACPVRGPLPGVRLSSGVIRIWRLLPFALHSAVHEAQRGACPTDTQVGWRWGALEAVGLWQRSASDELHPEV